MKRAPDKLAGYKPLDWTGDSALTAEEQELVEIERRDLWRCGIRDPLCTRMAFEFAAVIMALRRPHPGILVIDEAGDPDKDAVMKNGDEGKLADMKRPGPGKLAR